jgi:hypothetical protein
MKMHRIHSWSWLQHFLLWMAYGCPSKNWNRDSVFLAPSIPKSLVDSCIGYIIFPRPVHHRHGLISNRDEVVTSSVFGLVLLWNPVAIFLGIALVVVLSFYRVPERACSHIFKEAFERFPLFGVSNSTASPVFEIANVWVAASGFHLRPGCVGVGVSTCGVSVGFVDFRDCLTPHASAGFGMAGCHFVAVDRFGFSARTSTYPVMVFGCVQLNNSQSIESLTYRDLIHSVEDYQQT